MRIGVVVVEIVLCPKSIVHIAGNPLACREIAGLSKYSSGEYYEL